MMAYRCADCGEPVAGFVHRVPTGLPFSRDSALTLVGEALRRHLPACLAQEQRREAG